MKRYWKASLALFFGLIARSAQAQDLSWQAAPQAGSSSPAIEVRLSAPEPAAPERPSSFVQTSVQPNPALPQMTVRGQVADPLVDNGPAPAVPAPAAPAAAVIQVQAQGPVGGLTGPVPPPPPFTGDLGGGSNEAYNCGQTAVSKSGGGLFAQTQEAVAGIPGTVGGWFNTGGRNFLQSDHCFDVFSSPVTNPFYFQDPRALTQIKPLMVYNQVPNHNPAFQGGQVWWFGVTGSVAVTDWFSVVINKLGFVDVHPHTTANGINNTTGFSEFSFGPQFTFLRSESTKTVMAAGLLFDLPIGSNSAFQSTGDLSLVPYLSFAQNFGKNAYGSFNYMSGFDYSFATDNQRNDFFIWSNHLDFDVLDLHKIYPMVELNWLHYTTNGHHTPQFYGFGGDDLMNFGSQGIAGHNMLSIAVGGRYKFAEWLQLGAAAEFPLVNQHDIQGFRVTVDLIFRY
jgi:hypothetical protein